MHCDAAKFYPTYYFFKNEERVSYKIVHKAHTASFSERNKKPCKWVKKSCFFVKLFLVRIRCSKPLCLWVPEDIEPVLARAWELGGLVDLSWKIVNIKSFTDAILTFWLYSFLI